MAVLSVISVPALVFWSAHHGLQNLHTGQNWRIPVKEERRRCSPPAITRIPLPDRGCPQWKPEQFRATDGQDCLPRIQTEQRLDVKFINLREILMIDYKDFLKVFFDASNTGNYFECSQEESESAFLHRFAAAGAALRYEVIHEKDVGDILALDIAIPRNELEWLETLPKNIEQHLEKKLYYGHFFCYVFHQDYILKKGSDAHLVKKMMLELLSARGAKYPAEHNVGHLYEAEPDLQNFYKSLDPTNTFNPGIGKMSKTKRNCSCCL